MCVWCTKLGSSEIGDAIIGFLYLYLFQVFHILKLALACFSAAVK